MQLHNSKIEVLEIDLLVSVHLGLVGLRRDIVFNFSLDRRHRDVGNPAIVKAFLQSSLLRRIWREHIEIDLQVVSILNFSYDFNQKSVN